MIQLDRGYLDKVTALLDQARTLDSHDELRRFRERFIFTDPHIIYFDGNSLGRLPVATGERLRSAVEQEWGRELILAWDRWIDLSRGVGDEIGTGVLGVAPGEVVLSDSTSINLYKLAMAALDTRPGRRVVVTDDDNFPTDRYVLEGVCAARGMELRMIKTDINAGISTGSVAAALDEDVALVSLSHVAYRSGARADMVAVTEAVHRVGAVMLWDLSHSVGSVPVPLREANAELAVGCTYKYLNGGPGAPAFQFVRADLQTGMRQPIWGWFGQRDQFDMDRGYDPVNSIERFVVGTPSALSAYAVLEGVRITAEAGIEAIAAKGAALTGYAITLADTWLTEFGFELATPREAHRRGAHITLYHPQAWQVCQAMRAAGVIPDFRSPDRLRIGLAPLYTRFEEVHEGLARLRRLMKRGAHLEHSPEPGRVT